MEKLNKLNLGCGLNYRKEYINIDKLTNIKTDLVTDFEQRNCFVSIEDDSIEEVLIFEVLEHISNLMPFMKEVWRVCKNGAKVHITVPYWSHYLSVIDPTHIRRFHEGTFQFFTKEFYKTQINTSASQLPIDFDFKINKIDYIPDDNYKLCSKEELAALKDSMINVIKQLYICLEVIK